MYDLTDRILRLNGAGLSNRAIARELGVSRESVNRTVRRMGAVSPFAKPVKPEREPRRAPRALRPGEVFGYFDGGNEECPVFLRAVVEGCHARFVHCRVEARRGEGWEYVYDQCFSEPIRGENHGLREGTARI